MELSGSLNSGEEEKEYGLPNIALMERQRENKITSLPVIKLETETNDLKLQHFEGNVKGSRTQDFLLENKIESVKIEKSESLNEIKSIQRIIFDDWKIKNEDALVEENSLFEKIEARYINSPSQEKQPKEIEKKAINAQIEETNENTLGDWTILNADKYIKDICKDDNVDESSMPSNCQEKHKKYAVQNCYQYQFQKLQNRNLRRHHVTHINSLKGSEQCGYKKVRHLRHNKAMEVNIFKCQTLRKENLKKHLMPHKNSSEVEILKCYQCNYQTVHKEYLKRHLLGHDPSKRCILKCAECGYETAYKGNLKKHLLQHENPLEIEMFKCDQCDFQSIHINNVKTHLHVHKDPKEAEMYKCDQCSYQTLHKRYIKRHVVRHKLASSSSNSVKMFNCFKCEYHTVNKDNLKRHLLRHKNAEEGNTFKCDLCKFETFRKDTLRTHTLLHTNPEEVRKFKCTFCNYQTIRKDCLQSHLLRHKNPEEVNVFKCDKCDFQTVYKRNVKRHLVRHRNPGEVEIFRCDQCNYQSVLKRNLKRHLRRHKKSDRPTPE